jgi:hypothetical protein
VEFSRAWRDGRVCASPTSSDPRRHRPLRRSRDYGTSRHSTFALRGTLPSARVTHRWSSGCRVWKESVEVGEWGSLQSVKVLQGGSHQVTVVAFQHAAEKGCTRSLARLLKRSAQGTMESTPRLHRPVTASAHAAQATHRANDTTIPCSANGRRTACGSWMIFRTRTGRPRGRNRRRHRQPRTTRNGRYGW